MIGPAGPTLDPTVLAIFTLVYAGMILGRCPGLAIDRTGIALLGAIARLATGRMGLDRAATRSTCRPWRSSSG